MSSKEKLVAIYSDLSARLENAWQLKIGEVAPVALHEPFFSEKEKKYTTRAIESGFISSIGRYVDDFSDSLQAFTRVAHAIPIVNGTSALQLALKIIGVRPGDEVIVPTLSFIATANAAHFIGAHPVFADINPIDEDLSLGISADSVKELLLNYEPSNEGPISKKTGRRLGAIVPMHTLGRLSSLEEISAITAKWGIPIVEDAAEAIGSFRDGIHPGTENIATLSFNGNKTITTGGGGAILTKSQVVADRAKTLSTTAKVPHPWRFSHSEVGWNFRLLALNAAVGLAQMDNIDYILERKRLLAESYAAAFAGSEFFEFYPVPKTQVSNNWLNVVKIKSEFQDFFPQILDEAISKGVQCRPMWDLLHLQSPYAGADNIDLSNSSEARSSLMCIPSSPLLARQL